MSISAYQATRLTDPSAQRRLIARAAEIEKSWPELPVTRQRTFLTALIERIDVGANRIDIHFRPTRLGMLLDIAAMPLSSATDEAQILSLPIQLRHSGREIKMLIEGTDPFVTAKPDMRLIKLLIRARRFNATLVDSDRVPFTVLAKREGVSPSYFIETLQMTSKPGLHHRFGKSVAETYLLATRCRIGGVTLVRAFAQNLRTCPTMPREKAQAAKLRGRKYRCT